MVTRWSGNDSGGRRLARLLERPRALHQHADSARAWHSTVLRRTDRRAVDSVHVRQIEARVEYAWAANVEMMTSSLRADTTHDLGRRVGDDDAMRVEVLMRIAIDTELDQSPRQ